MDIPQIYEELGEIKDMIWAAIYEPEETLQARNNNLLQIEEKIEEVMTQL